MLPPDDLKEALQQTEKAVTCCTRFCRIVGEYSDDNRYRLSHNGLGARDTDSQVVHSTPVLNLGKDALAAKLTPWIEGLHKGERQDLNATMQSTRGPAMAGWPWGWRWTDGARP